MNDPSTVYIDLDISVRNNLPIKTMTKDKELEEQAHSEHWDKRYELELQKGVDTDGNQQLIGSFEWYRSFKTLRPFLTKHLPAPETGCHILHLGCGNSVTISRILL